MINKRNNLIFGLSIAIIIFSNCTPARSGDKDLQGFEYREVYLPHGMGVHAKDFDLNSIDFDWGIWGHNMSKVLPEKPSESVYAKINDATIKSQFCFSSNRLFDYVTQFIDDNYAPFDHSRFTIMPNDNDLVCLCVKCVAAGNTEDNASPAVTNMIRKLAAKYPNHEFYTSDYRTTTELPKDTLPSNAGVLISAMPYPFTTQPNAEADKFMANIDQWRTKTNNILIWDYINNFDDYFTPYPDFAIMQDRFQNYRKHNVNGVFLNGSGSEESSFSKLRTLVFSELLKNPNTEWQALLRTRAMDMYPVTGETIANFLLDLENHVKTNNIKLPMYEGVAVARRTYLPSEVFIEFYDNMLSLRDKTSDKERAFVDRLLSKLALTRLEMNRLNGDVSDSERFLVMLDKLQERDVDSYNESGWLVENYKKDYYTLMNHARETEGKNLLKGEKLKALTPLDEDYSDISIITDGLLGMPSNYHNGHLITTPEKKTEISIPYMPGASKLIVWLSYLPGYKIYLPESVSLAGGGVQKVTVNPTYPKEYTGHYPVEFQIPENATGPFILTLTKDPEKRSMAIEEIEMF